MFGFDKTALSDYQSSKEEVQEWLTTKQALFYFLGIKK
jgi:hypothetical protein